MGWLGLGPRLVGRIGSGVQVSASFQIFVLRMLLFTQWGLPPGGILSRGNQWGNVSGGLFSRIEIRR